MTATSRPTRVCVAQVGPDLGRVDENCALVAATLSEAVAAGADVVVLPELATCGYVFTSAEQARQAAISVDDPRLEAWSRALAQRPGSVAVVGFAELHGDRVFNSALVLDGTGVLGTYRKVHLWDRERLWFSPGEEPPLLVDTAHGRLGVMICYDMEFPEWTRLAALGGADLLTLPTNWPHFPRPEGERVAEVGIAQATARMNHMAIAFADRSRDESGVAWSMASGIVDADGWLRASVGEGAGLATAELDLAASRDKSQGTVTDLFGDRRPDLYGGLVR
ncbi:nitrilase-related carbon-nitrogen hydrolase [Luteococcus peritonei]|uniref:Nitrilase-related carbon-nitrogen hydrolase n=1 Tax=Luteococcus peritonei TaxID=88874 RepID=A0ABW4RU34_9ACTN